MSDTPLSPDEIEILRLHLKRTNGRRRMRTLTVGNCLYACQRALVTPEGWSAAGGGLVANAYNYQAWQTVFVVARKSNGRLRWRLGVISAKKSASITKALCGLPVNAASDSFRDWADQEDEAVLEVLARLPR